MFSPYTRRAFLGSAMAGLAANLVPAQDVKPAKTLEEAPFQPSTLFLTWFRDPTTTMVVQWVGVRGETPDTTVYYGETDGDSWEKQKPIVKPYHPDTDLKVFRAELTGLEPDTEYDFKIGKNLSPTYKFRTMPTKATDTLSFISGGDAGINPHAVANNIQAARQNPAFVVIGGDLAYDNGKSVEVNLAFMRNYTRTMIGKGGRMIPLIPCIGNHEVNGAYNQKREKAPFFYGLFDGLYPETGYATLDFGDYLSLILLDTGHTSPIRGDQTAWLDFVLREREDHPNVMVVNHVPSYPSYRSMTTTSKTGFGTGEESRQHWVPLFEQHRVPVVLEHHDHTFKRTKPLINGLAHDNGVLYLGDGSWGRVRAPQKPEKLAHLALAKEDYHLTLHRIQGADRYHLALDENGRVMDVSHTGQRLKGQFAVGGPLPKVKS